MSTSILIVALIVLGILAVVYGIAEATRKESQARWRLLLLGVVSGSILIGIAQCLRLLLELNAKL